MNDLDNMLECQYEQEHKDFYSSPGFPTVDDNDPIAFQHRQEQCKHDTSHAGLCTDCFLPFAYWNKETGIGSVESLVTQKEQP